MSWKNRQLGQTRFTGFLNAALTLTSTPVSNGICAPFGQTIALFTSMKMQDWISTAEVWRPLGVQVASTTTITTTAPVITLQKAPNHATANVYASASAGGVATAGLLVAASANYYPFTTYTSAAGVSNFVADAAGDVWRLNVTTSPAAGAASIGFAYALIEVAGVSDALTTY